MAVAAPLAAIVARKSRRFCIDMKKSGQFAIQNVGGEQRWVNLKDVNRSFGFAKP
jgi:hypothetical protein